MNIAIIGAGIGGLSTALFLEKFGISLQVYEQAKEIKPIGAGIILAHNAMQVFEKLGLRDELSQLGNVLSSINICKSDLQGINKMDLQYFDQKYSVNSIAIQRGVLQEFLISKLKTKCIKLNKKLIDIQSGNTATLKFSDGDEVVCDAVIAADGINSEVRTQLFKDNVIRRPEQQCWRGIAKIQLAHRFRSELNELWGKGSRFGFVHISADEVYWYALHSSRLNIKKADLSDLYKSYAPVVQQILSQTNFDKIYKNEIVDLKPIASWVRNNVCLLGDAAHATTPNLGQGACQAIEDAYVLSHYLTQEPANNAFSQYERARKSKAEMIVNLSWRLGQVSQTSNPVISRLRNFAMRVMPTRQNIKHSEKVYDLTEL